MEPLENNYQGVFDGRLGFGERPALIIIDMVNGYTDEDSPLFAPDVRAAIEPIGQLLQQCRDQSVPVIFTRVVYQDNLLDGGLFVQKIPVLQKLTEGAHLGQIVSALEPLKGESILRKQYASCFFATSLASTLQAMAVDTVILAGCSTSGCVRATAVDGIQHGFRVVVPRECVGDRHPGPHEANLFDINAKYGDVISLGETMERLAAINKD